MGAEADRLRDHDSGPQMSYPDLYARGRVDTLEGRVEKAERDISNEGRRLSELEKLIITQVSSVKETVTASVGAVREGMIELKSTSARSQKIEWLIFSGLVLAVGGAILNLVLKR